MKTFKCKVEREEEYIVEFDEEICNEEWMKSFSEVFYKFDSLEEHAEHIVQFRTRFGSRFIEGYGVPLENGKTPYWAKEGEVNKAINIKVISEDKDIYVDVEEIASMKE